MLKSIKRVENEVKRSDLDPDLKKRALGRIREDYVQCETTKQLPSCNELLEVAIDTAKEHKRIFDKVEQRRKILLNKAINAEVSKTVEKLDELQKRISTLFGDRVEFHQGDNRNGQSLTRNGDAVTLNLLLARSHVASFAASFLRREATM